MRWLGLASMPVEHDQTYRASRAGRGMENSFLLRGRLNATRRLTHAADSHFKILIHP